MARGIGPAPRFLRAAGYGPLTIDEVQKCPELLPAIKLAVDRKRRAGRFLLSGSANLAFLRGIPESLAGRAVYLTLHPFSRRDLAGLKAFLSSTSRCRGGILAYNGEDAVSIGDRLWAIAIGMMLG